MSATELRLVTTGDALARVVDVALRMQEHEEVDRWEFADDVAEAVEEQMDGTEAQNRFVLREPGAKTGINKALDKVRDEIRDAGAPDVASKETVRGAFWTATAWPVEERVQGANYWAHYELRAKEYDGQRSAILKRLVARSTDGRVGTKDVRLWKSDRRPADLTSRDEKLDRRLRTALRGWASPQKFTQLAVDEQQGAAKTLYRLAREVETGEFE